MILFDKRELKILPWLAGAKFFLIAMVLLSVFVVSCDESSVVGLDVQPTNDLLDVTGIDTTTLITRTVKMDSLRTDETYLQTYALLGTYIDPVFGKSAASIYTQLKLSTENPDFGINPKIDSVVLSLVYDSSYCYGNIDQVAQNISVIPVLEDLKMENSYYSNNSSFIFIADLANNYQFIPNPTKNVTILGESLKPQLRIPLTNNIGQYILDNQGTENLSSNAAFQSFFQGLNITTENTASLNNGEGNIMRFTLADSQSKLTLYYHHDTANSLQYDFGMSDVARFSGFTHDFTAVDADLASQLGATPPAQNDVVFIQSMAGTKVKIEMPYLMNWNKSGPITINKAELVIKINTDANYELSTFAAPEKLMLYGIDNDGNDYVLPDVDEPRPNYFDGAYNATTQEYRINISRYIQQVLLGERKNNGLHLLALKGAINANRAVIGGGGNGSIYQMKLNITRTKAQ